MGGEHAYRYLGESSYSQHGGVALATAGGRRDNPYFFRGFVENAQQAAGAILAVAEVARTKYFDAGLQQRLRDPVVTSNRSVLRFESFSACNGVYARLDLDGAAFDAEHVDWGTTNVDINDPLRAALVGVAPGEPLRLSVGSDNLAVDTLDHSIAERKVPLPERWLRGFAEAQIASSVMLPVESLGAAQARNVIRTLPQQKTGNQPTWLQLSRTGVRLSQRADGTLPSLVGPQRLTSIQRLAPFVRALTIYAPPASARADGSAALRSSGWVIDLDGARMTIILSPEFYRGFSGEGSVLKALATAKTAAVEDVRQRLEGQAHLDPESFGHRPRSEIVDAFRVLGAAGQIGHDLAANAFFHRELPFDRSELDAMHPRLTDARELAASGAVELDGSRATVESGTTTYTVTELAEGATCNCAWFAKHRGDRGPCKHVLAVQLAGAEVEFA